MNELLAIRSYVPPVIKDSGRDSNIFEAHQPLLFPIAEFHK